MSNEFLSRWRCGVLPVGHCIWGLWPARDPIQEDVRKMVASVADNTVSFSLLMQCPSVRYILCIEAL